VSEFASKLLTYHFSLTYFFSITLSRALRLRLFWAISSADA
jgi:hypothetical protein